MLKVLSIASLPNKWLHRAKARGFPAAILGDMQTLPRKFE
jgi:hypothetical protein